MKTLILASAFAVAFAGFAGAAEVQKDKAPAPVVKAQKMSDSEMDKVTAAAGYGVFTAFVINNANGLPNGIAQGIGTAYQAGGLGGGNPPGYIPFFGNCTAGRC
jgi:hypothetical protein